MKKFFSMMLIALAFSAAASAQQVEKLFDKYMEDIRFQYIYDGSDIDKKEGKWINKGQKMLTLNKAEAGLVKTFSDEINAAIKTDGYKQTTFVRNGTNKVSNYIKETENRKEELTVIQNNETHIMFIWESYSK
ncbi:hypothetical protein [Proteiniphilum sp. UBA5384]|uniref:hypothetical protein n=1 Tax=Proteiniphilum sp. UBA5384 TaxID=1947279 RepID=UPI0025E4E0B5|nr:hypothetical protein [Proteiniphilum sp. UBA5384]